MIFPSLYVSNYHSLFTNNQAEGKLLVSDFAWGCRVEGSSTPQPFFRHVHSLHWKQTPGTSTNSFYSHLDGNFMVVAGTDDKEFVDCWHDIRVSYEEKPLYTIHNNLGRDPTNITDGTRTSCFCF